MGLVSKVIGRSSGAVYRGGNWNNNANAGMFNANLNNDPSNANTNIGFRCAAVRWDFADLRIFGV